MHSTDSTGIGGEVSLAIFGVAVITVAMLVGPMKCSTTKIVPEETMAVAGGMVANNLDGGLAPLSRAKIDIVEQKAQTLAKEVTYQSTKLTTQKKRVDNLEKTVAQIRWQLIEERFEGLQAVAERKGWAKKAPRRNSDDWDNYKEWVYIKTHQDALREGKRLVPAAQAPLNSPHSPPDFRPNWATE